MKTDLIERAILYAPRWWLRLVEYWRDVDYLRENPSNIKVHIWWDRNGSGSSEWMLRYHGNAPRMVTLRGRENDPKMAQEAVERIVDELTRSGIVPRAGAGGFGP